MLAVGGSEWEQDDREREFQRAFRLIIKELRQATEQRKNSNHQH